MGKVVIGFFLAGLGYLDQQDYQSVSASQTTLLPARAILNTL